MPAYTKSLTPGGRLTLVLACDKDLPTDEQPRFFAKYPSVGESRELLKVASLAKSHDGIEQSIDAIIDAAMVCLTGWENMREPATGEDIPFNRESVSRVLTLGEIIEVIAFVSSAGVPDAGDKKKSESPPS